MRVKLAKVDGEEQEQELDVTCRLEAKRELCTSPHYDAARFCRYKLLFCVAVANKVESMESNTEKPSRNTQNVPFSPGE